MKDVQDWLLPFAGGSAVAVLALVGCAWELKRLTEWAAADALAKGLEDHRAKIDERLADQQRAHEEKLETLRSELRAVESEAADLRAHSLGLAAERRRNYEAKRAEVCAELFAAASRLGRALAEVEREWNNNPEEREVATSEHVAAYLKALEDLGSSMGHGELYLSEPCLVLWEDLRGAVGRVAKGDWSGSGFKRAWSRFRCGLRAEILADTSNPSPTQATRPQAEASPESSTPQSRDATGNRG